MSAAVYRSRIDDARRRLERVAPLRGAGQRLGPEGRAPAIAGRVGASPVGRSVGRRRAVSSCSFEDHQEVADLDRLRRPRPRRARRCRRAARGARSASSSPPRRGAAGRPRPRRPATTETDSDSPRDDGTDLGRAAVRRLRRDRAGRAPRRTARRAASSTSTSTRQPSTTTSRRTVPGVWAGPAPSGGRSRTGRRSPSVHDVGADGIEPPTLLGGSSGSTTTGWSPWAAVGPARPDGAGPGSVDGSSRGVGVAAVPARAGRLVRHRGHRSIAACRASSRQRPSSEAACRRRDRPRHRGSAASWSPPSTAASPAASCAARAASRYPAGHPTTPRPSRSTGRPPGTRSLRATNRWNGSVVWMPAISVSSSAGARRSMAASRSAAMDQDLGDQRLSYSGGTRSPACETGVDPDARAGRHDPAPDPAGRRGEVARRVLGRDPDLDRVARPDRVARSAAASAASDSGPPGGEPELLADDVETGRPARSRRARPGAGC